jgi:3-oxoacyl-[acyl-carrier-protein] synthase II
MNDVVVTGMGAVCGLGSNVQDIWAAARVGQSGVFSLDLSHEPGPEAPVSIAGYLPGFEMNPEALALKDQSRYAKFVLYALHASKEALNQALLAPNTHPNPDKVGVILGVGMGGTPNVEAERREFDKRVKARTSPFYIPSIIPNMPAGLIALNYGFKGINLAVASACASSGHAIQLAYQLIQSGMQEMVICGGAEAVTSKLTLSGFASMKALSTRAVDPSQASCPFSLDRDGFVLGEGAAILVLESRISAQKRGATILAEVKGVGFSTDAHHITAPHPEGQGAAASMSMCLNQAGISPSQVDYINAHGTSTPLGDVAETLAIKNVFGTHSSNLSISSTKSMTGHLLGAAAALESIFCINSLMHDWVTPTINLTTPDPACDLDYTPLTGKPKKIEYALNNSFGFGGTNSSILFKKA